MTNHMIGEDILNCCYLQVISVDATSGGLCVSVCTANKLQVWDTRQGVLRVSKDSCLHHKVQSCYEIDWEFHERSVFKYVKRFCLKTS